MAATQKDLDCLEAILKATEFTEEQKEHIKNKTIEALNDSTIAWPIEFDFNK